MNKVLLGVMLVLSVGAGCKKGANAKPTEPAAIEQDSISVDSTAVDTLVK